MMLGTLFATWQDVAVTLVAAAAATTVIWRTVGHWRGSVPMGPGPGCDHCAIKNEAMRQ